MSNIDYSQLSPKEKIELLNQLKAENVEQLYKDEGFIKIEAVMNEYQITAEEITKRFGKVKSQAAKKPSTTSNTPKKMYKNPETGETWGGKGLGPKWLRDYVANGNNKEDLLIKE
jgi:DNA-binding protein H-NS